jgi:BASS family bile acid:Na+ symporter
MQVDAVSQALLPLGLMFIMFSLGMGLTLLDFKRVFAYPRAFLAGVVCHFFLLPLVAFALVKGFGVTGALAVGFMIIAACPTGTTSNLLTYFARGDVALALSFTAFAGLVSIVTVPLIVSAAIAHFTADARPVPFPVGQTMGQIFVVMGLPVVVGMLVRARASVFAQRWQPPLGTASAVVFVAIIAVSIARNWPLFQQHTASLAPLVIAINVTMLALGYGLARLARADRRQSVTVAIESSVQNATLAIVIASSILRDDTMMLPGAIYGAMMYLGGIAFVFIARRMLAAAGTLA